MSEMFKIKLPDGSVREMPEGSTPADVAAAIGPGLAKAALAARIDGEVRDLNRPFEGDSNLALITSKDEKEALATAIQVFSFISEKADTRNWQSLPHTIYYTRVPLQKGMNTISLQLNGRSSKTIELSVNGNGRLQFQNICTLK